jgi:hypothetical protein
MKNNMGKPIVKGSSVKVVIVFSLMPIIYVILTIIGERSLELIGLSFWLFYIAWEWLILTFMLNFYNFYEEYIEIFSPIRIGKKRKRKRYYSEIVRVVYRDKPSKDHSHIRIYGTGKKYRFSNFGNTLYSVSLKRTRQTLKFLESKGIPIEIIASKRREKKLWRE